jgi:hypothetical protein
MPEPIKWTAAMDSRLRQMRDAGQGWDAVATEIGVSRWAVIQHAKDTGAYFSRPGFGRQPEIDRSLLARMIAKSHRKAIEAPVKLAWSPKPIPPARDCQWPMNDPPRGQSWVFCGAASLPGRSYCAEHRARSLFLRADAPAAEAVE